MRKRAGPYRGPPHHPTTSQGSRVPNFADPATHEGGVCALSTSGAGHSVTVATGPVHLGPQPGPPESVIPGPRMERQVHGLLATAGTATAGANCTPDSVRHAGATKPRMTGRWEENARARGCSRPGGVALEPGSLARGVWGAKPPRSGDLFGGWWWCRGGLPSWSPSRPLLRGVGGSTY